MMWLTCFILVFGIAEFYQWVKHFSVPLPVFILAGALLAIASNYKKYAGWSFQQHDSSKANQGETPSVLGSTKPANWVPPLPKPTRPISFTITRPTLEKAREDNKEV